MIAQARDEEGRYLWREASEIYGKIIAQTPDKTPQRADIQEKLAEALYRQARQAGSAEEFREGIGEACKVYDQARQLYDSFDNAAFRGRSLRCQAMVTYLASRNSHDSSQKKRMVEEAW